MPASRNPTSWDQYHGRASPAGSQTSSVLAQEQALIDDEDGADDDHAGDPLLPQRRRYNSPLSYSYSYSCSLDNR